MVKKEKCGNYYVTNVILPDVEFHIVFITTGGNIIDLQKIVF